MFGTFRTIFYLFLFQIKKVLSTNKNFIINLYEPSTEANSKDPDQMPQNVASDQGLHCFLTKSSIKI